MRLLLTVLLCAVPVAGQAQTGAPLPPNPADRALADSASRAAADRARADADRTRAVAAARAAAAGRSGPVAGSTMTDGVAGLGTRPDTASPAAPVAPPATPPQS